MIIQLARSESCAIQNHPVRVERCAVRRHDHDGLANRIDDRAKVRLILPELPLGALIWIDVDIDTKPADKVGLFIVNRRRRDLEPSILSVEAAKAHFGRASLLGLPEILPPVTEFSNAAPKTPLPIVCWD